jgi:hypothetical protein
MQVPIDARRQYPKLMVELTNAMMGRDPRAGVVEQVVGDKYILDKYPPATRTDYVGSSTLPPLETPEPKEPTAGQRLWPNLKFPAVLAAGLHQ